MLKAEILELLERKQWKRERLALALDCSVAAVHEWIRQGAAPRGPATVHMRHLLREARGEIRVVELQPIPCPSLEDLPD